MSCLPAEFNLAHTIDETLRDVQRMLDLGRLKINADTCQRILATIEQWQWEVPKGISLELVNRADLKPRKSVVWSHFGDALRYLVGGVLRMDRFESKEIGELAETMPRSAAGEIVDLFDRALGTGLDAGGQW